MRAQAVDVKASTGRVLYSTVFQQGGKKLLAKGHIISPEDVSVRESHGMATIRVTELEEGEVSEDVAVLAVAREMGCGSYEIRPSAGGRANLVATENCCVLVDEELLKQINCTAGVVTATLPNFSYARSGQRIATVKSAPFAVDSEQVEAISGILRERGPILQARPIRTPVVAALYTDSDGGEDARHLFESIMQQRLDRVGVQSHHVLFCKEDEHSIARAAAIPAVETVRNSSGFSHDSGGARRCDRPGRGPRGRPRGKISGPGRARKLISDVLQR